VKLYQRHIDPSNHPAFRQDYVVAEKINNLRVEEGRLEAATT